MIHIASKTSLVRWALLVTCCVSFAPICRAEPPKLPAEAIILSGMGRGQRGEAPSDPVATALVAGKWTAPKAGDDPGNGGNDQRRWRANPIKDAAIAPAGTMYAYVPITSDSARTTILHASGHSTVFVNGEIRAGDIYGNGIVRIPVTLRQGVNDFLFVGGRGGINVKFEEPRGSAQLDNSDTTAPDFVTGSSIDGMAGTLVRNNTNETLRGLTIETSVGDAPPTRTPVPPLLPMSVRKVGYRIAGPAPEKDGQLAVNVRLLMAGQAEPIDALTLNPRAVPSTATRRKTFVSEIDGSVQYYGYVPALPSEEPAGLVLTLHGAGVEGAGQAACYGRKPGLHVVAPTNRRPFGFDWEDWGRLDAMEVLRIASKELAINPRKTYLTGHSMGGHGTWHLGVTYPGRFAAIAPSAGWISFATYAGGRRNTDGTPEQELRRRATANSDTLSLVKNLTRTGIYILHGDVDDNVPVGQARTMRKELSDFHPDFAYYERPGAGHWWGNACVDWPPIFDYFARHELPARDQIRNVSFSTANPAVSADCHWATIEAQVKPLKISSLDLSWDEKSRVFSGSTDNVARLSLDLAHLKGSDPIAVKLDGQSLTDVKWTEGDARIWLSRDGEKWSVSARPAASLKGPHRAGPFKDAFRNRMMFVYGTKGTPEENAWALAKARYDAETFWYRGNGSVDVIPDTDFQPAAESDRSVILYGHADMNSAWSALLGTAPIQVKRGSVTVGDKEEKGDQLGCLFAVPRSGSDRAMVAVVAGTGLPGMKLTERQPYLASGSAYADWTVIDSTGLRGTGFFGNDWSLEKGESAWKK